MKKYFKYSILGIFAGAMLASCATDPETGLTRLTHYATFDLVGGEIYTVPVGDSYAEPGVICMEGSDDISDKVITTIYDISGQVVNSISTNEVTLYNIEYLAYNVDGFSSSATRTVFVYNPEVTGSCAGTFDTDMDATIYNGYSFMTWANAKGYATSASVTITELCPGIYYTTDFLAGWYEQLRGYGASYAMYGYFCLNPDNTISEMYSHVNGWGDSLDYLQNGRWDEATGTLSYETSYAGQIFINPVLVRQ
jgi:hypothetical protein